MSKFLGLNISRKKINELDDQFREKHRSSFKLIPGARKILSFLKKNEYKLAIISNGTIEGVNKIINNLGLRKYFDLIVISQKIGKEKSTTIPINIALKKLKLKPEEAVMVGDRLDEDVLGAKRLRMIAVKYDYGIWKDVNYSEENIEPDFVINDLLDLKEILSKLNVRVFDTKKQKRNLIKWYESTADRYDSWDDKKNYDEEMKSVDELLTIKKGEKLLDVATGTGNYLIMAAKKGAICYGVDITPKMIKVAQEKVKKLDIQNVREIKIGDVQKLDYENEFFDWVLCIGMMEYYPLEIAENFLKEFKRVLKKDGRAIVDFPDFRNPKAYEFKRKSESVTVSPNVR